MAAEPEAADGGGGDTETGEPREKPEEETRTGSQDSGRREYTLAWFR